MIRIILVTSFLFSGILAYACDPLVTSCRRTLLMPAELLFRPQWNPPEATFGFRSRIVMLHTFAPVQYYPGIRFDDRAVFCRMENHFLTHYNVKFSIHAGGYSE